MGYKMKTCAISGKRHRANNKNFKFSPLIFEGLLIKADPQEIQHTTVELVQGLSFSAH